MSATHSLDLELSSSQYASIASASNLAITGSRTFMAWIKMESQHEGTIFGKSTSSASNLVRLSVRNSDAKGQFQISGLTTTSNIITANPLPIGIWTHLAGVFNGSTLAIYVNGELSNSGTASGSSTDPGGKFGIGVLGDYTAGNYFDGIISNAMVFDSGLTQTEIRQYMNTFSVTDANLQGHWLLNNDYTDESSNGYDLTA